MLDDTLDLKTPAAPVAPPAAPPADAWRRAPRTYDDGPLAAIREQPAVWVYLLVYAAVAMGALFVTVFLLEESGVQMDEAFGAGLTGLIVILLTMSCLLPGTYSLRSRDRAAADESLALVPVSPAEWVAAYRGLARQRLRQFRRPLMLMVLTTLVIPVAALESGPEPVAAMTVIGIVVIAAAAVTGGSLMLILRQQQPVTRLLAALVLNAFWVSAGIWSLLAGIAGSWRSFDVSALWLIPCGFIVACAIVTHVAANRFAARVAPSAGIDEDRAARRFGAWLLFTCLAFAVHNAVLFSNREHFDETRLWHAAIVVSSQYATPLVLSLAGVLMVRAGRTPTARALRSRAAEPLLPRFPEAMLATLSLPFLAFVIALARETEWWGPSPASHRAGAFAWWAAVSAVLLAALSGFIARWSHLTRFASWGLVLVLLAMTIGNVLWESGRSIEFLIAPWALLTGAAGLSYGLSRLILLNGGSWPKAISGALWPVLLGPVLLITSFIILIPVFFFARIDDEIVILYFGLATVLPLAALIVGALAFFREATRPEPDLSAPHGLPDPATIPAAYAPIAAEPVFLREVALTGAAEAPNR